MKRVIILGGGPGGAAMGCYLSKARIPNTIIEKAMHPRAHVGESLVPATTRVLEELGFLDEMERQGFPKKYGASWNAGSYGTFSIDFAEFPQRGVNQPYTYHVDRGRFDLALLKHAEKLGSQVIQGVTARHVTFDDSRASGVDVDVGGSHVHLPAHLVIDATGRSTLLGQQLRIKEKDPQFDQFAVHAWFKGVERGNEESRDHIRIYFLPVERGWAWQIPITDDVTSIGIVVDRKVFTGSTRDVPAYFAHHLALNNDLKLAMSSAEQINDYKLEGDYSYRMSRFVGDHYMLVGDAARFVDPIFSSGVSVALTSAKFASELITTLWSSGNFERVRLLSYEEKLKRGTQVWYEFITRYYRLLPLFTYFINNKTHREGVLQLLQGEVFDRAQTPVLDAMDEFLSSVETNDKHFLYPQLRQI